MTDVFDMCPNVREEETKSPCSMVTQGNVTKVSVWQKFKPRPYFLIIPDVSHEKRSLA